MNTLRTIWRRLTRDLVDLLLLLSVIAVLVKAMISKENSFEFMIFFGALLLLYILGVIWRMGNAMEIINEYVKDSDDRQYLNLFPYELRDRAWKKPLIAWLFVVMWVVLLVFGLFM